MPIPSQTGIPYNKLATKSMVMDMRHKCNYKIRKNEISRTITCAFARSIAFQNPIHPIETLAGTLEIVILQTNSPVAPGSSAIIAPLAVCLPAAV